MPITQPAGAVRTFADAGVTDTVFSPDGTILYVARGGVVTAYDVRGGQVVGRYADGAFSGGIDISPDGRTLLAVDRSVREGSPANLAEIDVASGRTTFHTLFSGNGGALWDVAWLTGNRALVSENTRIGSVGYLRELDLATGTFGAATQSVGPNAILTASGNDGRVLVQPLAVTRTLHVYTAGQGLTASVVTIPDPYAGVSPFDSRQVGQAVNPSGDLMVDGVSLLVRDAALRPVIALGQRYPELTAARGLAFSADGERLFVLTSDRVFALSTADWSVVAGYTVGTNSEAGYGNAVQIAPGGFLSTVIDGVLKVIDLNLAVSDVGTTGGDTVTDVGRVYGFDGDDVLTNAGGIAYLYGGGGNDVLRGVSGTYYSTFMYGGSGDDRYYVTGYQDVVLENGGSGYDTVYSVIPFTLPTGVEALVLTGINGSGYGNALNNRIDGNDDPNTLGGLAGDDVLNGLGGTDTLIGGDGTDALDGGEGDDTLYAQLQTTLYSFADADHFYTAPLLDTGAEIDRLVGGGGDDIIFAGYGDTVDGGGNGSRGDRLFLGLAGAPVGVTLDLGATSLAVGGGTIGGIESVSWVDGSAFGDTITGGTNTGTFDRTQIYGLGGDDRLTAGSTTGALFGGDGDDVLDGRPSIGMVRLDGGIGNDTIHANRDAFTTVRGGAGDDTIYAFGQVRGDAGNDRITLGDGVFTGVVLGDSGDDEIRAGDVAAIIAGGAGADLVDGGAGNDNLASADWSGGQALADTGIERDRLFGGGGDDILAIGFGDDADGGNGTDTLRLSLLGATAATSLDTAGMAGATGAAVPGGGRASNVEALTEVTGSRFDDAVDLAAQTASFTFTGGLGNDALIARSGGPITFIGGVGSDRIVAAPTARNAVLFDGGADTDTLSYENAAAGVTVLFGSFAGARGLGRGADQFVNVEEVVGSAFADTITGGSAAETLRGGAGDDRLEGGGGNDLLDGGTGADTMVGGLGDDIFVVDDAADVVTEAAGEGFDTVRTALSGYVLPANVEALVYTGTAPGGRILGNAGDNSLTGSGAADQFDLSQGGDDRAVGGGGEDGFFFGAALTAADRVDGGEGDNDQVGIQGDYTGANRLVIGAATLAGVEVLALLSGGGTPRSYDVVGHDAAVAAGRTFTVFGGGLAAGENLTFDGSAETDGSLLVFGGLGTDTLTGGAKGDGFYFGPGRFGAGDVVRGGAGADQLGLDGHGGALLLDARVDVEVLALLGGPAGSLNTYGTITVDDGWVAAGDTKTITAVTAFQRSMPLTTPLTVDGSRERDGNLVILGGGGDDELAGGRGTDRLFGGAGADRLTGGAGADTFLYNGAADSSGRGFDRIDLSQGDRIDLAGAVTGVRADVVGGRLSDASFDADLAAAVGAGRLGAHQVLLFRPDAGEHAGKVFLVADADGVGGYQAGSDYLIELTAPVAPLDLALFI